MQESSKCGKCGKWLIGGLIILSVIPAMLVMAYGLMHAFEIITNIGYPENLVLVLSLFTIYFSIKYISAAADIMVYWMNKDK